MKVIYKYPLAIMDEFTVTMPKDAKMLTVQMQNNVLILWALIDTEKKSEVRLFRIIGTGNPIDIDILSRYLGSVQDRMFVWHIFDAGPV